MIKYDHKILIDKYRIRVKIKKLKLYSHRKRTLENARRTVLKVEEGWALGKEINVFEVCRTGE